MTTMKFNGDTGVAEFRKQGSREIVISASIGKMRRFDKLNKHRFLFMIKLMRTFAETLPGEFWVENFRAIGSTPMENLESGMAYQMERKGNAYYFSFVDDVTAEPLMTFQLNTPMFEVGPPTARNQFCLGYAGLLATLDRLETLA